MTFLEKTKDWIASTGLTNMGWIIGCVVGILIGWKFVAGICLGLFIHFNYTKIKELIVK